jgi:hypothetical protein
MTSDPPSVAGPRRRLVVVALVLLLVWVAAIALLLIGVIRSADGGEKPQGIRLAVGVALALVGAVGSLVTSISFSRTYRTLPSPPEASRAERLEVVDDIKRGRVSDNVALEVALASRLAQGTRRMAALGSVLVVVAAVVVIVPGTLQTIAFALLALVALAMLAVSVPQTRRAERILDQLPPAGAADPGYQAKIARQVKSLWRWTGAVFALGGVVVLVLTVVGDLPVGIATGMWIGLVLIWTSGYLHSSWISRPR